MKTSAGLGPNQLGIPQTEIERQSRIRLLVSEQLDFVARLLRNLGTPSMDVDDAVQRTFIKAVDHLQDIPSGYEKAFLFKVAVRVASHARRSLARRREVAVEQEEGLAVAVFTPESLTDQKRMRDALDAILEQLPAEMRSVFVLHEFEGLTMAEIANVLEIPAGTVASRLRRARAGFRSRVQRMF